MLGLTPDGIFGISIHALREEGDKWSAVKPIMLKNFYPRPPRGGRQSVKDARAQLTKISIHALREEGDPDGQCIYLSDDISIHALREEGDPAYPHPTYPNQGFLSTPSARRATDNFDLDLTLIGFLSTPSARRATTMEDDMAGVKIISIHALREEGD